MKTRQLFIASILGLSALLQSCTRTGDDVWDDTKSAGRHIGRGIRALAGYDCHSRQICSRNEFEGFDDECTYSSGNYQDYEYQDCEPLQYYEPSQQEFIPLQEQCNDIAMNDMNIRPPRENPGERGSSLPGIQAFRDPSTMQQLCDIFHPIYFDYNCFLVKGGYNLQTAHAIANYLRSNPGMYIFVEGHTDERGPHAYNQSLGLRRANAVRNFLISAGVNPDQVFTISYGKERPVVLESHEEGWARNRRAEFKVYVH